MSDPPSRVLAIAAPATLTDTASDTLRGIGFVILAYVLLTVGDVLTKLVLPEAGESGAMIERGVFDTLDITGLTLAQPVPRPWRMLVPKRWAMVLLHWAVVVHCAHLVYRLAQHDPGGHMRSASAAF